MSRQPKSANRAQPAALHETDDSVLPIASPLPHDVQVSFEFFPPKSPDASEKLFETIRELESLAPSYVSVTYGAGGSTVSPAS